jgi:hypothetical protein
MNLIKGLFGAFRNTTAHAPKIHWNVTEQDALEILTTISLIHRRSTPPPERMRSRAPWPLVDNSCQPRGRLSLPAPAALRHSVARTKRR